MTRGVLCVAFMLAAVTAADAQCTDKSDFGSWLTCRIQARIAARQGFAANASSLSKQQDTPTVSPQSTSLVDQSSASDLFNLALNLAKVASTSTNNTNSISATTSAYALYAAANYHDPLDPSFYARNREWRRAYITLGRDLPNSTSASLDPHLQQPGTIAGIKFLLYDRRDITDPSNQSQFTTAANVLAAAGGAQAKITLALQKLKPGITSLTSFANFSDQENLQIDGIIDQNIQPLAAVSSQLQKVVENIRSRPQWALLYNGDFRNQLGYNEHKVETVYAFGSSPRTNLTFNADYQHWSAKSFGPDRQGGDLALAFDYRITEDSSTPQPYVVSFSAQGEWLSRQKAVYKGQAKLTIPLGQKTGLSIPMSVTYASSADLIQESRVEGRFGFSFDVAKIAAAFAGRQ